MAAERCHVKAHVEGRGCWALAASRAREDGRWPASRSPKSVSRDADPGHDRLEGRCVTGLTGSDVQV